MCTCCRPKPPFIFNSVPADFCHLQDTLDSRGRPIVELPAKTVEIVRLQFSPEEREFYEALKQHSKVRWRPYTVFVDYFPAIVVVVARGGERLPWIELTSEATSHVFFRWKNTMEYGWNV